MEQALRVIFRFASSFEDELLLINPASFSGEYLIAAVGLSEYGAVDLNRAIELLCHEFWDMGEFPGETPLENLITAVGKVCGLGAKPEQLYDFRHIMQPYAFFPNRCLLVISDSSVTASQMLSYVSSTDEICLIFAFTAQAGEIWRNLKSDYGDDGVHYFFHSKENCGHNVPHVHADYRHDGSASISILDGKILVQDLGKFPSKRLRAAQNRVLDTREELLFYWNNMTDGLYADPDYLLGKRKVVSR